MVLVEAVKPEDLAGRVALGQANRAQSGTLVNEPGINLPERKFSLAVTAENFWQSEAVGNGIEANNRASSRALNKLDFSGILEDAQILFMAERELDGSNLVFGTMREIGDGAVHDLAILPKRFSQEMA
jgi:hypothetical protein